MFFGVFKSAAVVAIGVVLGVTLSGDAAVASDGSYEDALQHEKAALAFVSGNRLQSLVSEPKQQAGSVSFSKSWLDAQPKATGDENWRCLSEALYFEARGESVKGQFAVAEVIQNRVSSSRFPDTLCGVINQGTGRKYQCQFTYTCDGNSEAILEPLAFERVSKVARAIIDGKSDNLTNGATHYHTTSVRPKWSRVYTKTANIGVHLFYRHNYRATSVSTQSKP
ncbi:MAG: cell wall hydrolase [Paracoccaceae bacterium]